MTIAIPPSRKFADLQLERDDAGGLHYLPDPLAACCRANGLDVGTVPGSEDLACWLVTEWYAAHLETGGERDAVVEQVLADIAAANASGSSKRVNRHR